MRGIVRTLTGYLAGTVATIVVIAPGGAIADQLHMQASWCEVSISTFDWDMWDPGGRRNLEETVDSTFICPVPSDDAVFDADDDGDNFDHKRATSIAVDVEDANDDATGGSVSAAACITWFDGFGGSCGASAATGTTSTGTEQLTPGVDVWTSGSTLGSDYPCISVVLPDHDVGYSKLLGYTVSSR